MCLASGGGGGALLAAGRRHRRLAATGKAIGVARAELACLRPAVCLGSLRFGGARAAEVAAASAAKAEQRETAPQASTQDCVAERALVRCGWAWCAGAGEAAMPALRCGSRKEEKHTASPGVPSKRFLYGSPNAARASTVVPDSRRQPD